MDGLSCDSSDDDHPTALDAEVGVVHPINLSDLVAEEALYDIQSMRAFCGLELRRDAIPDETTILNFRHLLETHALTKAVFAAVAAHLEARGALLRGGTIVDATLIAASPSTKNKEGKRDPEMRSSKKGNQWYFGMKSARRRRRRERARAHRRRHGGQRARREGDGSPDPRGRHGGLRRQGLRQPRYSQAGRPQRLCQKPDVQRFPKPSAKEPD
jgi:hypothetical protein